MAQDAKAACDKANAATAKAQDSGRPVDHDAAAKAHKVAASAAFAAGDPEAGKRHSKQAKKHKAKGSGGNATAANPLAAWMKAKAG